MRINPISNIRNTNTKYQEKKQSKNNCLTQSYNSSSIPPFESVKAKYCPAFGKYKKVSNVMLVNKKDGSIEIGSLKREKYGKDFISYKLFINGEEAGYMDMDCSSVFPEGDDFVLTEPDNVIPEIEHLRSLLGNKYTGIGSALVNAAVKESENRGKNGCLWLTTEKGYAWTLSDYRAKENPIPFYYKLGFKAVDSNLDNFIKECLKKSDYNSLPNSALLLLTPEAIKQKNKYFASNYSYS